VVFAVLVGSALVFVILLPFFVGKGGPLEAGLAIQDPEQLMNQKKAFLERYLIDEKAQAEGLITDREWRRKRQFLTNRYVDASRRMDALGTHK